MPKKLVAFRIFLIAIFAISAFLTIFDVIPPLDQKHTTFFIWLLFLYFVTK